MIERDTSFPDIPWLPPQHLQNRERFPPAELIPFRGQDVAWDWEGDRIVSHAPSGGELFAQLDTAGIDSRHVVEYTEDL